MRRVMLSLLATSLLACDQSPQPTGPAASGSGDTRVSAARAKARPAAASKVRFQLRELAADALFESVDGCIVTDAIAGGAARAEKIGSGKATTGPLAFVSMAVFDICTDRILREILGETDQAVFSADRVKLGQARLQATIPAFDAVNNVEVQVAVDLAWTGVGDPFVQVSNNHIRQGGILIHERFKGTFRDAEATGTISVGGETLLSGPSVFAQVFRVRRGDMTLERTR
jgi:hypothetical protein